MKSRRIKWTGNVHGAHGDDFYKLSLKDFLWLAIGGSVTTGSDVIYFWGRMPPPVLEVRATVLCNCGLTHSFDDWRNCPMALKPKLEVYSPLNWENGPR